MNRSVYGYAHLTNCTTICIRRGIVIIQSVQTLIRQRSSGIRSDGGEVPRGFEYIILISYCRVGVRWGDYR
jgi:hypothetical protein